MVKRKADGSAAGGSERGKAKVAATAGSSRQPPPPPPPRRESDDSDSDFCEIIENPTILHDPIPARQSSSTNARGSTSGSSNSNSSSNLAYGPASAGGHMRSPAALNHRGQNLPPDQGALFSMFQATALNPYNQLQHQQYGVKPHLNHQVNHRMHHMQMSHPQLQQQQQHQQQQIGSLMSRFPMFGNGLFARGAAAGFQSHQYNVAGVAAQQAGVSPAPVHHRAQQTEATPRVREGAGAEEVKEEPDDTALRPTPQEVAMVEALRAHGVPSDDAVQSLRVNHHNVQEALKHALRTLCDRENCRNEDMARYASEQEKEKLAATRRQEDMELTVLGDIAPRFQQSLLLDEEHGCEVFRRAIQEMCSGKEECTPALCAFREKAVQLLFLERDAFKWYRDVQPQVRGYFRQLAGRLARFVSRGEAEVETGAESGGAATARGEPEVQPAAESSGAATARGEPEVQPVAESGIAATAHHTGEGVAVTQDGATEEEAGSACESKKNGKSKPDCEDSKTRALTARVEAEVETLRDILFKIPSTSGGVPDAFLKCTEHTPTLDVDGVEELRHSSAQESRSSRADAAVVILDDG